MRGENDQETPGIRIIPVFPLPNTVFFPDTSLPLHVFEPRYRAMIRDVADGDGLIVVSLCKDKDDGFCDLGTVGRVQDLERFSDGRFNIRLEGLERVSLSEVPGLKPYREVQVESRPEQAGTDDASALSEARLDLLASYGMLRGLVQGSETFVLHQELPFEVVVNSVCASLPIDASIRQQLLSEDKLIDRQRLGMDYLSAVIDAMTWLRASKDGGGSFKN